ncbi:MAG: GFA family protein [Burkholderiales bacterium]|nr:GFA family protein [Burkholderiales bacterium]MCA3227856.1 GFA family protein [Burkholderiales bacterium]
MVRQVGQTHVYAFHHAAQDHDQARHFCARCGTTLFWFVSALPDLIGIAGGCFAGEALPEPTYSVTDGQREPWVSLPGTWKVWAQ